MNFFQLLLCNSTCAAKPRNWSTCYNAAARGHLEVLQWAREHGCAWEDQVYENDLDLSEMDMSTNCCAIAASAGHLAVLKWWGGAGY